MTSAKVRSKFSFDVQAVEGADKTNGHQGAAIRSIFT